MVGIIYKREATHSHDVSARELRLMPYQNWCRNIREFSLPKFTYLRSVHIFIRVEMHAHG